MLFNHEAELAKADSFLSHLSAVDQEDAGHRQSNQHQDKKQDEKLEISNVMSRAAVYINIQLATSLVN